MASDAGTPRAAGERLAYVDALRAIALAGVFVVHAASPFDPWDRWHVTSPDRSRVLGEVVVLLAPWLMPLVALLAGVGAWHSLRHRSNGAYLRERAARLLVPLGAGMVLLVPPQLWLERRMQGRFDGSLLDFYSHLMDGGLYPRGNLAWHHLWFLAHLFAYAVLTLPLLRFLQGERGARGMRWLAARCGGRAGLLWLAIPLVVQRHLLSPLLTGDRVHYADWSNRGLLPAAFVLGFVLAGERRLGEAIDRQWRGALAGVLAGAAMVGVAAWHGLIPSRLPAPFSAGYLAFWSLYAIGAWSWMVVALGAGRRWLRTEGAVVRYARAVGAAFYLLHQPVIVAVAFVVVRRDAPLPVRAAAVAALSLAATLLLVEALRFLRLPAPLFGLERRA